MLVVCYGSSRRPDVPSGEAMFAPLRARVKSGPAIWENAAGALLCNAVRGKESSIRDFYGLRRSTCKAHPGVFRPEANQTREEAHDGRVVLHGEGEDVRGGRKEPPYGAHRAGCL